MSATLATASDQTLFQSCLTPWDGQAVRVFNPYTSDVGPSLQRAAGESGTPSKTIIQRTFGKTHRGSSPEDHTTYEQTELANTLNTFDVGESRANEIVCMTDTQTNTTIVAGGGALGSLCARLYKDPPVLCSQTLGKSQAPYAPQTARRGSRANHGEREKSCVRSGLDPICMGSDAAKSSIDVDMCGTLHVGGVCHSLPETVGALQARDWKGVGNQYVREGKVIVQWE